MKKSRFSYGFVFLLTFIFIITTLLSNTKSVLGKESKDIKNDGAVEITSASFESEKVAKGLRNTLRIDYKILNKDKLKEGDVISITLPEVFKEISPKYPEQHFKDFDLKDGVLTLTFNENVDKAVKGYMLVSFVGDENIRKGVTYPLTIDLSGKKKTFYVEGEEYDKPSEGMQYPLMYKTADLPLAATDTKDGREYYGEILDRNKPIKYFVEINLGDGKNPNTRSYLSNATFVDTIPEGMALDVYSLCIKRVDYNNSSSEDVTEDFIRSSRVRSSLNSLEIDFGDIRYERYTVSYETRITSTKKGYSNEAKLTYDDGKEVPARHYSKLSKEAGALNVHKEVDRTSVSSRDKDQKIKYTIRFDSYGQFFKDTVTIKDNLDKRLKDIKVTTTSQFESYFNKDTKELIVKNTKGAIDSKEEAYITIEASMKDVKPGSVVDNVAYVNGNPTNKVSTKKNSVIKLVLDSAYYEEEFYNSSSFRITTKEGEPVKDINNDNIEFLNFKRGETKLLELPVGSYKVEQVKFPEGHERKKNTVKFEVKKDSGSKTVVIKGSKKKLSTNLLIEKVNEKGKPLKGAEFNIFKAEDLENPLSFSKVNKNFSLKGEENNITNLESIEDSNKINIKDLPYGEYVLREVKAPKGYKIGKDIYLYINEDRCFYKLGEDGEEISLNKNKNGYKISVKNSKRIVLPNTGGLGTYKFSFIGVTLLAGALSLLGKEIALKEREN